MAGSYKSLILTLAALTGSLTVEVGMAAVSIGGDDYEEAEVAPPSQQEFYETQPVNRLSEKELAQADALRVETIDSIEAILKSEKPGATSHFELLLRLGELQAERHDYVRGLEIDSFTKSHDEWQARGKKGVEPTISHSRSRDYLSKAAQSFRDLVRQFPAHPRIDAALYALGTTLSRLGQDNAEMYFNQLIKNFPKSNLIVDTHLSLGEHYFDAHKMEKAIASYKMAASDKSHKAYPYVIYKLAWSYYSLAGKDDKQIGDNLEKAIAALKLVIQLADGNKAVFGRIELRKEAIQDLIVFWADSGDVDSAWSYFDKIGEAKSFYNMLERLGRIYADQGKFDQSIQVFERIISEEPLRARNLAVSSKLLEIYEASSQSNKVATMFGTLKTDYIGEGKWVTAQKDEKVAGEAKDTIAQLMHRYGTMFHDKGEKTQDKTLLRSAADIYELYLSLFSDKKEAYDLRYYLADLQFEFGEFLKSATNYTATANASEKDGKYLQLAAMNAVVAMFELQKQATQAKADKDAGASSELLSEPKILSEVDSKLIDALDNYVRLIKNDENTSRMAASAADILFSHGFYKEASERYNFVVNHYPKSIEAQASAEVLVGYQIRKQNWSEALKWLAEQEGKEPNRELAAKFKKLKFFVLYERSVALEKSKEHLPAADSFMELFKSYPNEDGSEDYLFSSAGHYFKAGEVGKAVSAYELLLKSFKSSKYDKQILVDLGQSFEGISEFAKAAEYYESFARRYPEDKRAGNALFNAALLSKGLKKFDKAVTLFNLYVRRYPNTEQEQRSYFDLAEIHSQRGQFDEAINAYQRVAARSSSDDDRLYAMARVAEVEANLLKTSEGMEEVRALAKTLRADSDAGALGARNIVAKAMFDAQLSELKKFTEAVIEGTSIDMLNKQIKNMQRRLEGHVLSLNAVGAVGSPEMVVASLYTMGELHEAFFKKLLEAKAPANFDQEAIVAFSSDMEKLAFPLKEEAYRFFNEAFEKSQQLDVLSLWTRKAYGKMSVLAPADHPEIREEVMQASFLESLLHNNSVTQSLVY